MGRDPKHDYRSRCIYHITIGKAPGCPEFSHITGTPEDPKVEKTPIGFLIGRQIHCMQTLSLSFKVLQYVIMPDHIHFGIQVREPLPRPLGSYIGAFKVKCGQHIRASYPEITDVFTPGFHDRHLRWSQPLDVIYKYIRDNPRRLLVRRCKPDFFRRVNNLEIGGHPWQAYGNMQLLESPFKGPVVCHRSDSAELRSAKYRRWRHLAENGGVLVSPFISPAEKEVRAQCEQLGGKIILISNEPFGEREKPASHDFDLCCRGRLLILAPMQALPVGRQTFLYLNFISEQIASGVKAPAKEQIPPACGLCGDHHIFGDNK